MQVLDYVIESMVVGGIAVGVVAGLLVGFVFFAIIDHYTDNTDLSALLGLIVAVVVGACIITIPEWGYRVTAEVIVDDFNVVHQSEFKYVGTSGEITTLSLMVDGDKDLAEEKLQELINLSEED